MPYLKDTHLSASSPSASLLYSQESYSAELPFLEQIPQIKAWGQINLFLSVFPTHFAIIVEYAA